MKYWISVSLIKTESNFSVFQEIYPMRSFTVSCSSRSENQISRNMVWNAKHIFRCESSINFFRLRNFFVYLEMNLRTSSLTYLGAVLLSLSVPGQGIADGSNEFPVLVGKWFSLIFIRAHIRIHLYLHMVPTKNIRWHHPENVDFFSLV